MDTSSFSSGNNLCLLEILCFNTINFPTGAIVDMGAEQNLISKDLVEKLQIPTTELTPVVSMAALTGQTISSISLKT